MYFLSAKSDVALVPNRVFQPPQWVGGSGPEWVRSPKKIEREGVGISHPPFHLFCPSELQAQGGATRKSGGGA